MKNCSQTQKECDTRFFGVRTHLPHSDQTFSGDTKKLSQAPNQGAVIKPSSCPRSGNRRCPVCLHRGHLKQNTPHPPANPAGEPVYKERQRRSARGLRGLPLTRCRFRGKLLEELFCPKKGVSCDECFKHSSAQNNP